MAALPGQDADAAVHHNDAVGTLYYSREIPSLFKGLRLSKLYGRGGIITFESNGAVVFVRGVGGPRLIFPGVRDIRGYQAMYRDFTRAIADYSKAIELKPDFIMAYRNRARAYEQIGDKVKAKADAQKVVELEKQKVTP